MATEYLPSPSENYHQQQYHRNQDLRNISGIDNEFVHGANQRWEKDGQNEVRYMTKDGEEDLYRPASQTRYITRDGDMDFYPEHKQHSPTFCKEYVIFRYIGTTTTPPQVRKKDLIWRSINTQKYTAEQIKKGEAPEVPRARKIIDGKPVQSDDFYRPVDTR